MTLAPYRPYVVSAFYACDGTTETRIVQAKTNSDACTKARREDTDNGNGFTMYGKIVYRARLATEDEL